MFLLGQRPGPRRGGNGAAIACRGGDIRHGALIEIQRARDIFGFLRLPSNL
jgi:hypothetical protein